MARCFRTSTARANVDVGFFGVGVVVGLKRARRARVMDCQIWAERASSVEM